MSCDKSENATSMAGRYECGSLGTSRLLPRRGALEGGRYLVNTFGPILTNSFALKPAITLRAPPCSTSLRVALLHILKQRNAFACILGAIELSTGRWYAARPLKTRRMVSLTFYVPGIRHP